VKVLRISKNVPHGKRRVLVYLAPLNRLRRMWLRVTEAIAGADSARRFGSSGDNVSFDPRGTYTFENIYLGSHVNLGARACLIASRSRIQIGNHVMFGPDVTIRGGNHRIDVVGKYMDEVTDNDKLPQNDLGVVVEDDVWVGQGAVLLGGVTVGRGSVVGAGSVVTKTVPPYSIVGGNPARVIRARFDDEQIAEHERLLGQRDPS
jgi:acetyltransferase-like isoleucine patch superfamily enzyme